MIGGTSEGTRQREGWGEVGAVTDSVGLLTYPRASEWE